VSHISSSGYEGGKKGKEKEERLGTHISRDLGKKKKKRKGSRLAVILLLPWKKWGGERGKREFFTSFSLRKILKEKKEVAAILPVLLSWRLSPVEKQGKGGGKKEEGGGAARGR